MMSKNEYWENEARKQQQKQGLRIQYAAVIELTIQGEPIIQFDGDLQPSKKIYSRMKHYSPAVGDRVRLIDNIIDGGWTAS